MAESKFWRTLAVMMVASVFYLAHGLHESSPGVSLPGLTQELHAGDVATTTSENSHLIKIVTCSDDGKTIHVWTTAKTNSGVTFKGTYTAE